ncbi:MAG: RNA polymerase sigma-54 factor, partial [Candidatus Tectomicrobia bacterium]|nr:RNA polymerase sigma-54 factor [Candidatus Tectomicrobia bacterium]
MAMEAKLAMKQTQKLVMTQMLQQAIKLLPLSRLELIQVIRQELTQNPLLEEVTISDQELSLSDGEGELPLSEESRVREAEWEEINWEHYMQDDPGDRSPLEPYEEKPPLENRLALKLSLSELLLRQLSTSANTLEEKQIGIVLIGNIDEDGYLRDDLNEIACELGVSLKSVEQVLALIQTFDPPGIGARTLEECLLLQLQQLE